MSVRASVSEKMRKFRQLPFAESAHFMLFLSPLLAMPQQHGGCVYPNAVLNALHAAGTPIDYAWLAWPLRGHRAVMREPLRAGYVRRGYVPGTFRMGGWRLRAPSDWLSRPPAPPSSKGSGESLPGSAEQTFFHKIVRHLKPRTVLVDFTTTLPVLDGLPADERAKIRVAVLTHNSIHRRTELYREDRLHLNAAGYKLWTALLAPHIDWRSTRFEKDILAFEDADRAQPPAPGGVLFTGAS